MTKNKSDTNEKAKNTSRRFWTGIIFKFKNALIYNGEMATVDNVDVADSIIKLLTTLGDSENSAADKKARAIIEASASKYGGSADLQELYLEAVKLVGTAETPKQKRVLAEAYSCCHTEYTLYAIKAMEEYIKSGFDFTPLDDIICKPSMTNEMLRNEYISGIYSQLGKLYETSHDFDKALSCYRKQLEYDTWSHFPYLNIAEIMRKKNDLDSAIATLEEAKTHPNYSGNQDFFYSEVIDNYLNDLKQKKERGYVFRKKKHKDFIPLQ